MNSTELRAEQLKKGILAGDRFILAKAITLIESNLPADQLVADHILKDLTPHAGNSVRIGITGSPGVGKSTFIEAFGKFLSAQGKKLAILTIDPSSHLTGGSILGDKTRMQELAKDERVFIRPSPSGHALGGVAAHTRETIMLCEAAGFDYIIVETVGTGQSEVTIRSMVDFFLLLIQPGSGDELQGMKKGIVEMADAIAITKSDGENRTQAKASRAEFQHAVQLLQSRNEDWKIHVTTCSALSGEGLGEISALIDKFVSITRASGYFERQRSKQKLQWFKDHFLYLLSIDHKRYPELKQLEESLLNKIESGDINARDAASQLLSTYHNSICK